ncbi:DegV family protein [Enterococcus sp.]|uniref:DegV family protein n=1 Tax=Enterococcus sp. TaxID=35783 RepID=UPI002FC96951
MRKLKIVTDSSCTMDPKLINQLEIHVVPLSVMINDTIYTDDETLGAEKFMTLMASAKDLPKTSQPPIGKFAELYDELGEDGSDVLSIHMTKALSGTVEAARQASQLSKTHVVVIDSDTTDQALSFAVIKAAELAQAGQSLEEVLPVVENILAHTKLYIGLSSLENLVKGGRISRAQGMLSSFLNMRVVMELKNAELVPLIKGRGNKTFSKWFEGFKEELNQTPNLKQVAISYAGDAEPWQKYADVLREAFPQVNVTIFHTTPVIATHTGSGAFAMMYYSE